MSGRAKVHSASISTSLINRVKARDLMAWQQLAGLYTPVVYGWARRAGLQESDAEDVVQDVFVAVAKDINRFRREQSTDTFRGWLWTIYRNRLFDFYRRLRANPIAAGGSSARFQIEQVPDNPPLESTDEGIRELSRIRTSAFQLMRDSFPEHLWVAFWRTAVEGDVPANVADDLGVSVWVVYKAKARVAKRLRDELEGLVEL